jgi:hypothetical protein
MIDIQAIGDFSKKLQYAIIENEIDDPGFLGHSFVNK